MTKSEFLNGQQCIKRLWLQTKQPGAAPAPDASVLGRMHEGTQVGRLARGYFAEDARFEVTAEYKEALARADVLLPVAGREGVFDIVEVKSSGYTENDKAEYLWDLAFQRHVFEGAGYAIRKTALLLIDKEYVRQGEVDAKQLFRRRDVTAKVSKLMRQVPGWLTLYEEALRRDGAPEVDIGVQCHDPHDCPYVEQCWKDVPDDSVLNLRKLNKHKRFELFHSGVRRLDELPKSLPLNAYQLLQIKVFKSGQAHLERKALRDFIGALRYPVYHLDFETAGPALPAFEGMHAYENLCFQYSLHVQDSPGGEARHFEFLADGATDPREALVAKLLPELGESGTILAYNASFEKQELRRLAEALPHHAAAIERLGPRFKDLEHPFGKGWYLHPKFRGSSSIKAVLPALVPELSYEGLGVSHGVEASQAYLEIADPKTPLLKKEKLRGELLEYCGLDTLAMVKLLDYLRALL